jgi:hypothetical protein
MVSVPTGLNQASLQNVRQAAWQPPYVLPLHRRLSRCNLHIPLIVLVATILERFQHEWKIVESSHIVQRTKDFLLPRYDLLANCTSLHLYHNDN